MNNKTRKLLVPLGTLLLAAGVTFGSGATWTSEHSMSASVTGGHLVSVSDHDTRSVLSINHLAPGDTKDSTITLTEGNKNDVDGTLELDASGITSAFTDGDLMVRVQSHTSTQDTDTGFVSLASLGTSTAVDLVHLNAGFGTATVTISVQLIQDAGNEDQGATATADLNLVTTSVANNDKATVTWTKPAVPVN